MDFIRRFFPVSGLISAALGMIFLAFPAPSHAAAITHLPTSEKVVALTFDACEAGKPAHLDEAITGYLVGHKIPFTIFAGGKFTRDNKPEMQKLQALPFVEIENHSWSHNNHMPALSDQRIKSEVVLAEKEILKDTGRQTHFFRFPAGNDDSRTDKIVEGLGYQIVHWRWATGDPSKAASANRLVDWSMTKTRPGDILIFHINGRGWHTAEALPRIVDALQRKGYRFVLLKDYIPAFKPGLANGPALPASLPSNLHG